MYHNSLVITCVFAVSFIGSYSYTSDIWSFGLVLIYLATGRYPYPKSDSYIEMVQTILESPPPKLPSGFVEQRTGSLVHRHQASDLIDMHGGVVTDLVDSFPNSFDRVSTRSLETDYHRTFLLDHRGWACTMLPLVGTYSSIQISMPTFMSDFAYLLQPLPFRMCDDGLYGQLGEVLIAKQLHHLPNRANNHHVGWH